MEPLNTQNIDHGVRMVKDDYQFSFREEVAIMCEIKAANFGKNSGHVRVKDIIITTVNS